jgi:hypothetical protein
LQGRNKKPSRHKYIHISDAGSIHKRMLLTVWCGGLPAPATESRSQGGIKT